MSATIKGVVARLGELVAAVDALLAGKSMETITQLVAALGIGDLLLRGADALEGALRRGLTWIGELRESAAQTDALRGLLGLLEPMLRGVQHISAAAEAGLEDIGLGALQPAVAPARALGAVGHRVLVGADAALRELPSAEGMTRLGESVTGVLERLETLRATVQRSALPPSGEVAPQGGAT